MADQHDMAIADAAGAAFLADLNLALLALAKLQNGNSAPGTTYAYQWWADTANGLLKRRNAANSAWLIRGTLAETLLVAKSGAYTVALADYGQVFKCSGTFSLAFTAAATLGDGFVFMVRNTGSGTITLDPNSTELIDGASTLALAAGDSCLVFCDGTGFYTVGRGGSTAATQAEMESASSTGVYASPGRMQYHPGVAKAWVCFNGTGTPAPLANYNCSSITDNGTGDYTALWDTDMSSANYAVAGMAKLDSTNPVTYGGAQMYVEISRAGATTQAATGVRVITYSARASAVQDPELVELMAFGDQA